MTGEFSFVCENLQEADEDISEHGDGSVILCTDGYTIYEDIEETEGWTAIWPSPTPTPTSSVTPTQTLARTATVSFASGWQSSVASRSITSKKYLRFLALKLNSPDDWFEKLLCYKCIGMSDWVNS